MVSEAFIVFYLIGSIPSGVILGKLAGIGDIRNVGSGNIGATNMLRAGGKKLAAITLICDMMKGVLCLLIVYQGMKLLYAVYPYGEKTPAGEIEFVLSDFSMMFVHYAGAAVMLGHCFPIWLGFKGGKGVATLIGYYLGYLLFSQPNNMLFYLAFSPILAWLFLFCFLRISSIAGMGAAVAPAVLVTYCYMIPRESYAPMLDSQMGISWFIAFLVVFQHRGNIRRLLKGDEPKVSFGKKE